MNYTLKPFMTLFEEVNHEVADRVVSWIVEANMLGQESRPPYLELIINSQGGSIYHGIGIINAMIESTIPIHTVCAGSAASMAAHIFIQGERGFRYMQKWSSLLFHSSRVAYDAVPMEQMERCIEDTKLLNNYLDQQIVDCSRLTLECVKAELVTPLDRYVYATEAILLDLCDVRTI